MKKNVFRVMWVCVLVFSLVFVSCNDGTNVTTGGGGRLTVTNIPTEFNGMYAHFAGAYEFGEDPGNFTVLYGFQSINISTDVATLVLISNGTVVLPMWEVRVSNNVPSVSRYSGSHTILDGGILISTSQLLDGDNLIAIISWDEGVLSFVNGSATISALLGELEYYD